MVQVAPEDHASTYSRAEWMANRRWDKVDGCKDVRAYLLVQASMSPVAWGTSGCTVASGTWISPYNGDTLYTAAQLQIDHLVPLSEANQSGAAAWPSQRKHEYANDYIDSMHLLAVDGSSNSSKQDKDPPHWMPPAEGFACTYLDAWARVKSKWGLTMDTLEFSYIQHRLDSCVQAGLPVHTIKATATE